MMAKATQRLTALMFVFVVAACRPGAEAPAAVSAAAQPPPVVRVFNGAGRADVCRGVAATLALKPAPVPEVYRDNVGRLFFGCATTVIRADSVNLPAARDVRARLGFGDVKAAEGVAGVEVVVGWDAAPAPPASAPDDGVFVSLDEKAVFFLRRGGTVAAWPCATGKPASPTPTGTFEVTTTLVNPTWYWQGKAIPPGPDNGLGDWFIGINKKGYGLHGTNEPASIGTAASHGCIRMYNEDAGELVKLVAPGTTVVIAE